MPGSKTRRYEKIQTNKLCNKERNNISKGKWRWETKHATYPLYYQQTTQLLYYLNDIDGGICDSSIANIYCV